MSILDDAIREHLELKRAHGADDSELKKLEDEAFGPPQRPDEADPFAEAPTEFLTQPGESPADAPEAADEAPTGRRPDIADLQEAPPTGPPVTGEIDELSPTPDAPPPSPADAAEVPLPPPPAEAPAADLAPPTGEEPLAPPAAEASSSFFDQFSAPADEAPAPPSEEAPLPTDEAAAPPSDSAPLPDEERHAIADQPTQMFDVQAHVDAEAAEEAPATGEQASPTDEEIVDAAQAEPHAAPPAPEEDAPEQPPLDMRGPDAEVAGHPPAEAEPEEGSAEFDFFNEQRLSDELDQALEAPLPPTEEHLAMPRYEDAPEPAPEQGGIFDFQPGEPAAEPVEHEEEPVEEDEATDFDPETGHEDVLEDTPRFLEDSPDDDDLWFEQKPPKDFDLD
jgi:hypothetical protein